MFQEVYSNLSARLFVFLDQLKLYQLIIICTFITLLFYFPDFDQFKANDNLYHSIGQEIQRPLLKESYFYDGAPAFNAHTENRRFRLFVPLTAHILHLSAKQMIFLQFLLLPIFFLVVFNVFLKIGSDRISASLLTLAFPFFYVAESFFWFIPIFDSFGYFLLALLFLTNNKYLRYFILILVCYCDERAILSSTLVFIALHLHKYKTLSLRNLLSLNSISVPFIAGWITAISIRFCLMKFADVTLPITNSFSHNFNVVATNFTMIPLSIFLAFEGFWVLILPALFFIVYKKKWFDTTIIFSSILLLSFVNLMVYDITRSFGYCYPFIFICFVLLAKNETVNTLRNLSLATLIGCFVIPTMLIYTLPGGGAYLSWLSPIFPKILRYF